MRLPGAIKSNDGSKIVEAGDMLIFTAGFSPIYGKQILYFQDPVFDKRSKCPAPPVSDRIRVKPQQDDTAPKPVIEAPKPAPAIEPAKPIIEQTKPTSEPAIEDHQQDNANEKGEEAAIAEEDDQLGFPM